MSYARRTGLGQTGGEAVDSEPVNGQMAPGDEMTAQVCPPECPPGHPSLQENGAQEPAQAGMDYSLGGKGGAMLGWFVGALMTAAALHLFVPEK